MGQAQLVQDPSCKGAGEVLDGAGVVVKSRAGRHDDRSHAAKAQEVAQMDFRKRRFPGNQDEGAAFLEGDVRGPVHQVAARA